MLKKIVIISCIVVVLIILSKIVDDNIKEDASIPNVNKETLEYFRKKIIKKT